MPRALTLLVGFGLMMIMLEAPLQAYLDPGSGSMLIQLLLGGVAAGAVVLRMFWQRLTSRLSGRHGQEPR